jgi:hypothetical protein
MFALVTRSLKLNYMSSNASASSASTPAASAQAVLASVLDFLFAANLDAADAFATAKRFVEGGVTTREEIKALTPARAKELSDKKVHRKLLAALKRMPTLDSPDTSTPSTKRPRQEAQLHAPPAPTPASPSPLEVVLNRSPVMILWAAACATVTAQCDWSESLSLGSACAALFARAKGASLGLYASGPSASVSVGEGLPVTIWLLGRAIPAARLEGVGVRGYSEPKHQPGVLTRVEPAAVFRYLSANFGEAFGAAWVAMRRLAEAVPPAELAADANRLGYTLYQRIRPSVPDGLSGWGQPGRLVLADLDSCAAHYAPPPPPMLQQHASPVKTARAAPSAPAASAASAPDGAASGVKLEVSGAGDVGGSSQPHSAATAVGISAALVPRLFELISAAPGGLTLAALGAALGVEDEGVLRAAAEELQLDGAIYERDGRLLAL